jgi:hypothetical protein
MVFRYSTRLSRRTVTRPGSGLPGSSPKAAYLIQRSSFCCSRVKGGLLLRRHQTGADILQDLEPEIVIQECVVRSHLIERDIALLRTVTVTIVTIFFEDRLNILVEIRRSQNLRARRGAA